MFFCSGFVAFLIVNNFILLSVPFSGESCSSQSQNLVNSW